MTVSVPKWFRYAPLLLVPSIGYVTFGYAAVPSLVVDRFASDLVGVGLLMSVILLAFGLVLLPAGWFFDRTGTTVPLLVGTIVHGALAVVMDLAPSLETLLALRFVWGLVAGFLVVGGAVHIARLYTGGSATRMQGIYGGMVSLGGAFGFAVVPLVTQATGWFGVHALGAVLAVPALVIFLVYSRADDHSRIRLTPRGQAANTTSVRALFTDPIVVLVAVCYIAVISSYVTLTTFVTAFFEEAGVLVSLNIVILVLAGLARAAGGMSAEQWNVSDSLTIAAATAAGALGFLGLAAAGTPVLLVILPMVTIVAVSAPFGPIYNLAAKANIGEGRGLGAVIAVGNLAALAFPAITGLVREATGGYHGAFLLFVAINLIAVGAALVARRTRRQ